VEIPRAMFSSAAVRSVNQQAAYSERGSIESATVNGQDGKWGSNLSIHDSAGRLKTNRLEEGKE
jgi:hypothetical protein